MAMNKLQENLSKISSRTKMLLPAAIISLASVMSACSSTPKSEEKHNIKFVVFYGGELRDTLSFESEKTLKLSYFWRTNHIDEGNSIRDKKTVFETTAPIKVLENK